MKVQYHIPESANFQYVINLPARLAVLVGFSLYRGIGKQWFSFIIARFIWGIVINFHPAYVLPTELRGGLPINHQNLAALRHWSQKTIQKSMGFNGPKTKF
ncbi:MAG: hypothetical protein ABIR06_21025 [Cyclobacteriaceae bacterium]